MAGRVPDSVCAARLEPLAGGDGVTSTTNDGTTGRLLRLGQTGRASRVAITITVLCCGGWLASYWNPAWMARTGSLRVSLARGCFVISMSVPPAKFYFPTMGSPHFILAWEWGLFVRHFQGFGTDWVPSWSGEADRSGRVIARHLRMPLLLPAMVALLFEVRRLVWLRRGRDVGFAQGRVAKGTEP